jgi:hypothetical protein
LPLGKFAKAVCLPIALDSPAGDKDNYAAVKLFPNCPQDSQTNMNA